MKNVFLFLVALTALGCAGQQVQAANATPAKTESQQQSRMKNCATQYHQKKIAKSDYKKFMSQCLKNPATTTPPTAAKPAPAKQ